ncbi:hypothetical protein PUN28_016747 [Cardiocondyla obscurior]|uniref:Transmembrane protein n=1 Tax=Cardiocondyla obscurior TaxID=286306 RepID=A0AAW2ENK2_9HYME
MRTVNEDQTVKEINPHINMSPVESPLTPPPPPLVLFLFLAFFAASFPPPESFIIDTTSYSRGEEPCTYFTFTYCHRLCLFTPSSEPFP